MTRTATCDRCGDGFVDRSPAQQRRFCSDNCRKRAHECDRRASCPRCGAAMRQGSRYGSNRPGLCKACRFAQKRADSIGHEVERLWAEGKSTREIAARLGWDPQSGAATSIVTRYRQLGFDLPRRYPTERVENQRRGRWEGRRAA